MSFVGLLCLRRRQRDLDSRWFDVCGAKLFANLKKDGREILAYFAVIVGAGLSAVRFAADAVLNCRELQLRPRAKCSSASAEVCSGEGFRAPAFATVGRAPGPALESLPRREPPGGWG